MLKTLKISAARKKLTSIHRTLRVDETIAVTNRDKRVLAVMRWEKYDAILETLAILEDEELVRQLRRSIKEADEGRLIPLEKVVGKTRR